jgi:hypothetical protein
VPADHAGHHRAGGDAEAELQRPPARVQVPAHLLAHGQRQLGHGLGVVGPRLRQPAGHHVGVADGLDLLQPLASGELVEGREQLVEGGDHPLGAASWLPRV